jgi:hypothetical protein
MSCDRPLIYVYFSIEKESKKISKYGNELSKEASRPDSHTYRARTTQLQVAEKLNGRIEIPFESRRHYEASMLIVRTCQIFASNMFTICEVLVGYGGTILSNLMRLERPLFSILNFSF